MSTFRRFRAFLARQRAQSERGQMLIVFALVILPISLVLSAVAVDTSVWQSERRGAQKDADLAALAGALELAAPAGTSAKADTAARASLASNDEEGNGGSKAGNIKDLIVDDSCFPDGKLDAVTVNLNHKSQTFFSSIFGMKVAPDIGAHAKACSGATQSPQGLVPIETDLTGPCFGVGGIPRITQPCPLDFGAQGSNPRGILDLQASGDYCSQASGSGSLEDLILNGATGTCLINSQDSCNPNKNGPWYDCVAVQDGNPTKVGRAFRDRIAREGACDTDGDGVEEFNEVVTLAFDSADDSKDIYEPRDCDPNTDGVQMSPRLITIIVLKDPPTSGNTGYPIYAFAGIYVEGCNDDGGSNAGLDLHCDNIKGALAPGVEGLDAEVAPVDGGTHFTSLNFADCGVGNKPTCVPTDTPTKTNTPTITPTRTPTPTPTNTPTRTPTYTPSNTPTPTNTFTVTPTKTPQCGKNNQPTCVPTQTPTRTPTLVPVTPTATATPGGGGGGNGHIVVWGRLVNLIFTSSDVGPPTTATTLFSISLVQ